MCEKKDNESSQPQPDRNMSGASESGATAGRMGDTRKHYTEHEKTFDTHRNPGRHDIPYPGSYDHVNKLRYDRLMEKIRFEREQLARRLSNMDYILANLTPETELALHLERTLNVVGFHLG